MKYALKRLIRGMGSADQNTVVGFSTCLASLLKSHGDLFKMSTIQEYIESELELKSSLLRGEEGMVTFGRVLVYGCIIRSNIIQQLNEEEKSFLLDQLLLFCYKRSYVSAPVYYYIENFLKIVNFDKSYVKIVLSHVLNNKFHMNIDMLHLLLTLQNVKLPSLLTSQSKFSISTSIPNIYQLDTLPEFVYILIDIRSTDDLNLNVYARFANNLLHVYSKKSPGIVEALWSEIENNVLTSRELTLNKKLAVFKLFSSLILHCESTQQVCLFLTPHFLHTVLQSTSDIPSDLVASTSPMSVLTSKFSNRLVLKRKSDKLGFESVEHSETPGGQSVQATRPRHQCTGCSTNLADTKILQTLINSLDKAYVFKLSSLYKDILSDDPPIQTTQPATPKKSKKNPAGNNSPAEGRYNNKDKIYVLNLFGKLVFHPALNVARAAGEAAGPALNSEDEAWKYSQVEYVFDLALGINPWNHEVATAYKKALFSLLGHNLHHDILERLVQHANVLIEKNQTKNVKITPEISNCWNKSLEMLAKLNRKIASCKSSNKSSSGKMESKKSILIAFQTMYLQLCLYLFLDNSISIDIIDELNNCYERFDEKKAQTDDENEPHWIEVITELFLSLLSKDSVLLRHLVAKAFKLLVPVINVQAVQQILQVLDPTKNPLEGQLEEEDSSDEDEEEEEDASSGEEGEEEEDEEEEEESDIDEEYLGNESNTDKLRQVVNQALGMNGNITDAESVDMSDMDIAEGKQLDAALARAFSAVKKPGSSRPTKRQSKAEQRVVNFRVRVLDLVESLASSPHATGSVALDILATLFVLLRHTLALPSQKALETRVRAVLRQYAWVGSKKGALSGSGEVSDDLLADVLLNSVLEKGDTSMSTVQTISGEISAAIMFLVRLHANMSDSLSYEDLSQSKFLTSLLDTLETFFTKRHSIVSGALFKSLFSISWLGNAHFLAALPSHAFSKDLRYYNRANALSLLHVLLKNKYFMDAVRLDKSYLSRVESSLSVVVEKTSEFLRDSSEVSKSIPTYTKNLCDVILTVKSRPDILKTRKLNELKPALESLTVACPTLSRLYAAFDVKKNTSTTATITKSNKKSKSSKAQNGDDAHHSDEEEQEIDETGDEESDEEEKSDDSDEEPVRKKKKKKHRQSKSRKKTKALRMADLSKGIEDVGVEGFSRLPVDKDAPEMEVDGSSEEGEGSESGEEVSNKGGNSGVSKKGGKSVGSNKGENSDSAEGNSDSDMKEASSDTQESPAKQTGSKKEKKRKIRQSVENGRNQMESSSDDEEEVEKSSKRKVKRKSKKREKEDMVEEEGKKKEEERQSEKSGKKRKSTNLGESGKKVKTNGC
ncbi:uncharacterized protein LOC103506181 [Diaphorina citri]|uniref:Uncharacterized protein LOC103506181 n=1 Tax=Diaphorina citri TaxID=121845 RepID=A0A3Q0IR42_DIACI|nr:uncharacterized protein LOC103506181 [Diaphorina citri]